jgi:putative heme-binding domain-containing protein
MKWFATALLLLAPSLLQAAPVLELKKGDHICIIGNTLAERMQHDGWLETYIYSRFPQHDLVFRNLGYSGDELTVRLRSASFGTPDQWLAGSAPVPEPNKLVTRIGVRDNRFELINTKADVVFAFFGYNESFAGEAGLEKFRTDLDNFIKHTLAQKYNGKSAPRLVLFSPIAHEDLKSPNLPDGRENNKRLELYSKAMGEVAAKNGVVFVDLFGPTRALYAKAAEPLTINGIHLTEHGNKALAKVIDEALFAGQVDPKRDAQALEKLRQAVLDKNFWWFNRYRVLDGYNVYGGRAFEKYADKQSNYEDQQRELEVMDVKTANRDRRIWAVAKGGDLQIDDSNCPPLIPVKSNRPELLGGRVNFLDGEEAIKKMTVGKNLKVSLFASEKEFPDLAKPVQMQFDQKGRLWVAVWPSYPHWNPTQPMTDKILVFEDTKGTGKADKVTTFADGLNCPTGFEFYNGGLLVAAPPDLWFLKDTRGTGKADLKIRLVHGLDSADSHHTSNSFVYDPGGAVYFQEGTFHHTQVESPYGPPRRCANGGVFRYEPRTQKFDVYVSTGFANPHGHVFDSWGQDIVVDGTGAQPYHGALFSGRIDFPAKHPKPPQVYLQQTRPCPGIEYVYSRHFPDEFMGNLFVANVITIQGILRYKIEDQGSSLKGTELEPVVTSTDPNFRPSDLKVAPDGSVYFLDWHNPIIGHLQHALRDPARDHSHGRIYRITYNDRQLLTPKKIDGEPIEKLLDLLKEPEAFVRSRARIELGGRPTDQVIAAAKKWLAGLDKKDGQYEHHVLEGLWLHQSHNVVDLDLLKRVLTSPDFHARSAAVRVLCYWRDRVPEVLDLLKKAADDPAPRVRLEAIRAASFFDSAEAMEIVLIANERPGDEYLGFTRNETMKVLDPILQSVLKSGKRPNFTTEAGARYLLRSYSVEQLLKMERTTAVNVELLLRPGVRDEVRKDAVRGLAKAENKTEPRVLLDAIVSLDDKREGRDDAVLLDLVRLLTARPVAELSPARGDIEKLATSAKQPVIREIAYVALVNMDGSADKAWSFAVKSVPTLRDLINATPLIADPSLRASLYPKIEPLLHALPKELATGTTGKTVKGRYVRIELPGKGRTLTLAEVEVYSDGQNVARKGKASQSSTAYGGDASRAIDGNKSGRYTDGGQTHTKENSQNPWWELDLGAEFPIDSVVIYNRTDDGLGNRLDGFTLRVEDSNHKLVIEKTKQPAPEIKVSYELGSDSPERVIRYASMNALVSVRGQEVKVFEALAPFVKDDVDRAAAIRALQRIPRQRWPKELAPALLDTVLGYIRKVPAKERTTPAALDALEFADALASLLPEADAKKVRMELGELGVRVIRIGTLPERMSYDKDVIAVKAGKPVEFLFENFDLMPHNLVITQPGALEEIGMMAEASATDPEFAKRYFVPNSKKVLLSSVLLQARETQRLSFTAPTEPGVYPIVCTYPGHFRRMYAALYVVDDLDAYRANPEAYLARNPLPAKDALLKDRRPRTEWKTEDLAATIEEMKNGRSFGNGKQMFTVASCVSCHKMEGAGNEFGPDLTRLDPKWKPAEILKDVIEPSFRINEKYQTFRFELKNGTSVSGLILEETPKEVKIIENPLAKAEPRILKVSDIESRTKSPVSMMPKGLLDKLTRDEVLDLMAYVLSKGDKNHPLFKGDGHDAHGPGHQH